MNRPRLSIGGLMGFIAVVACGGGLLRVWLDDRFWFRALGVPAAALLVSAGSVAVFLSSGPARQFAYGFLAGACLGAVRLVAALDHPLENSWLDGYLRWVFLALPDWLTAERRLVYLRGETMEVWYKEPGSFISNSYGTTSLGRLFAEVALGVPILTLALASGLAAWLLCRHARPNPAPDPTPT